MEHLCLLTHHTACFELAKGCLFFQFHRDVMFPCVEAESEWNTFACSHTILLALNLLRDVFFSNPIEM